eukprot:2719527-Pyramimonas_sp.AAC.1
MDSDGQDPATIRKSSRAATRQMPLVSAAREGIRQNGQIPSKNKSGLLPVSGHSRKRGAMTIYAHGR